MTSILLRSAILSLVFVCVRGASAATLVVPDDYPTVQGAITAAASGDEILIRDGTYNESLSLAGKDVTIRGENYAAVLTSNARILEIGAGVTSATVLERLVFRSGRATTGAALYLRDGAGVTIRSCRFFNNVARVDSGSSSGGALRVDPLCSATIESSTFAQNSATSGTFDFCSGGAVYVAATGTLTAVKCRFDGNVAAGFEGGSGGAIAAEEDVRVSVRNCEFEGNGGGYGGAISGGGGLFVEQCRFVGNRGTYGAAAIQSNAYLNAVTIAGNVFFDNDAIGGFVIEAFGPGEVLGNTIAFNSILSPQAGGISFGGGLHVENNIVARNGGVGIFCTEVFAQVRCNDVWGNGASNYGGVCGDLTGIDGNISEDPLFCDSDHRNLALKPGSPCAPSDPCGLIGALGVGCPVTDVPLSTPRAREVRLLAPRPNPGAAPIRFVFECARSVTARLEVLDLAGRRVATPVDRVFDAGRHEVEWDGRGESGRRLPPGAYVVRLSAGADRDARSFVLTR